MYHFWGLLNYTIKNRNLSQLVLLNCARGGAQVAYSKFVRGPKSFFGCGDNKLLPERSLMVVEGNQSSTGTI